MKPFPILNRLIDEGKNRHLVKDGEENEKDCDKISLQ